jgi:hypothetical protein
MFRSQGKNGAETIAVRSWKACFTALKLKHFVEDTQVLHRAPPLFFAALSPGTGLRALAAVDRSRDFGQ